MFSDNPYQEALKLREWKSIHDYVEVRSGVFLFYWFYYANGTSTGAEQKPLVIWIQGGPGLAASGVGNFGEIGPFDMNFKPRNHTWVRERNVLFIDSPVGTGFSYTNNAALRPKHDREVVADLTKAIKMFMTKNNIFQETPTYIFSQSYGGKLCPRLAYSLHTEIKHKQMKMNLKGIGIGSGFVDPKESTLSTASYLYNMGAIDLSTYREASKLGKSIASMIDMKQYNSAYKLMRMYIPLLTMDDSRNWITFTNIHTQDPNIELNKLSKKMNEYVKATMETVNQTVEWNYFNNEAYASLRNCMFEPSTSFLEMVLNETKLKVAVYNGNLDLITPLAGASNWVHKLKWQGARSFYNAKRSAIRGELNGYYKVEKQLSFWSVVKAGHWIPEDNPEAMEHILDYITTDND